MKTKNKKSVMGPIISVFVLILIVSILAGLTFLFVANLQTTAAKAAPVVAAVAYNESVTVTDANVSLAANLLRTPVCSTITSIYNATGTGSTIALGNISQTNCLVSNVTQSCAAGMCVQPWKITYAYTSTPWTTADDAINKTESSGYTVVGYLPLIFLAIIFGALLSLVLRIILPYINLGQSVGSF